MTPDDTLAVPPDAVAVKPDEIQKRITVEYANNYRRRHNLIVAARQQRRDKKIRKLRKMASALRLMNEPLSASLTHTLRQTHTPIPRALQGQVKQAGRTWDRFKTAIAAAKKRREQIEKEKSV